MLDSTIVRAHQHASGAKGGSTSGPATLVPARRRKRVATQSFWLVAAFTAPAVILMAIFLLYPVFQNVRYSLYDWNGISPATYRGLADVTASAEIKRGMFTGDGGIALTIPGLKEASGKIHVSNGKVSGSLTLAADAFPVPAMSYAVP